MNYLQKEERRPQQNFQNFYMLAIVQQWTPLLKGRYIVEPASYAKLRVREEEIIHLNNFISSSVLIKKIILMLDDSKGGRNYSFSSSSALMFLAITDDRINHLLPPIT